MVDRRWDKSKPPTGPWAVNLDSWQAQGLVSWVPGSPFIADFAPTGKTATITGIPGMTVDPTYGVGAIAFDGTSHAIDVGNTGHLTSLTLVATLKTDVAGGGSNNSYRSLISRGSIFEANSNFAFGIRDRAEAPQFFLFGQNGSTLGGLGTGAYTNNTWYRYIGAWGTNDLRLYANGVSVGTSTTVSPGSNGSQVTRYGRPNTFTSSDDYFDSLAYDLRIYSQAFSANECAGLYDPGQRFELWYPLRSRKWFSAGGGPTPVTATTSVSAAIQAARTAAASVNAAIQASASASASVNAAISQARTIHAALDAAVLQARNTTSSVDAAIRQALTSTASVDTVISAAQAASSGVDAAVVGGRSGTTSVSAYVQADAGAVASLDAYIQAGSSAATSVGAAISQARTGNATIDAVVARALTAAASLAAAVQEHRSATASINAYIQAGTSHSASMDAAIRAQQGASAAIGAAVGVARSASASLSAFISAQSSISAAVQAAILQARSGVASVGAYIFDPDAVITNSEWWMYSVPADDLSFAVSADSLAYRVGV